MLLSLFEENQSQDPENSPSKEGNDNLDSLFDEDDDDDEDGEGYAEPEEDVDATFETSFTSAESEQNRSKEDLEGKISSIPGRGSFPRYEFALHLIQYMGKILSDKKGKNSTTIKSCISYFAVISLYMLIRLEVGQIIT